MQELVGRLSAVDPEATQSLSVVAYFDTLSARGASIESLVRAATVLSGAAAGAEVSGHRVRVDETGHRSDPSAVEPETRQERPVANVGHVWLERVGAGPPLDEMILERLALAVAAIEARRRPEGDQVELLVDADADPQTRAAAASRLRLRDSRLHVLAHAPDAAPPDGFVSAVLATADGVLRVSLGVTSPDRIAGLAGVATARTFETLPAAWADARIAWRLSDERHPVVRSEELGPLVSLLRNPDPALRGHPDVVALRRLTEHDRTMIDELAGSESVRAAATALGMHHSSLQSRHLAWTAQLGYDPRSPSGRLRYQVSRILARLLDEVGS